MRRQWLVVWDRLCNRLHAESREIKVQRPGDTSTLLMVVAEIVGMIVVIYFIKQWQ